MTLNYASRGLILTYLKSRTGVSPEPRWKGTAPCSATLEYFRRTKRPVLLARFGNQ